MGLPITSHRQNKKFFDPAIFQKCWRGVGEQPTFAKQITKLHNEMQQKSKRASKESDSGGFSKSTVSHETKQKLLLEKPIFRIRQKGVPPLLLPTSVLQLPRCLVRTYNLDFHDLTLFELDSFKRCNCSRENRLQSLICFANVGYSPTPRQHF